MRRILIVIAVVGVVTLCGAGVWYVTTILPWKALPEESEQDTMERWAKVVAWSQIDDWRKSDGNKDLLEALALAAKVSDDEPMLMRGWDRDSGNGGANHATPSKDKKAAVAALLRWHRKGGPIGASSCPDPRDNPQLIHVMALARITLAMSERRVDDERVAAVLHLAKVLRSQGPLLHGLLGISIFGDAVDWATQRVVPPRDLFQKYELRTDEVFPMLARSYVCGAVRLRADGLEKTVEDWREAQQMLGNLVTMAKEFSADLNEDGFGAVDEPKKTADMLVTRVGGSLGKKVGLQYVDHSTTARELAWFRFYFGRRLEQLESHRNDLVRLMEHSDIDDPKSLPHSFVVRVNATDTSMHWKSMARRLAEYKQLKTSGPAMEAVRSLASDVEAWRVAHGGFPESLDAIRKADVDGKYAAAVKQFGLAYEPTEREAVISALGAGGRLMEIRLMLPDDAEAGQ